MHNSGRGEESPEPYRGTVFPPSSDESQAYGGQAQPAHGSPWGAPFEQGGPAAGQPAPAEATQMLPPYPAGMPIPGSARQPGAFPPAMPPQPAPPGMPPQYVTPPQPAGPPPAAQPFAPPPGAPAPAEATQMLPPYPAGDPGAGPAHHGAGIPPMPPQAAAQPPHPQFPGMPAQPEQPVEATQAMPLSIFQEQPYNGGYDGPRQDAYAQGGPGYPNGSGAPHEEPAAHDGGQGLGGDYDHLFRNDVPSPAPSQPHIIQPDRRPGAAPYGQGGGYGYPPQGNNAAGYAAPGHDQQGYDPRYGYDDGDRGGRRMSPKVLIGIVVASCVVVGLIVGGLLNSGDKASADNTGAAQTTAPNTPGSTSTDSAAPTDDAGKQQAQALDALLKTSGNSRTAVVNAVESIKNCQDLPGAASDLRGAAGQRNGLVTQLGALSVDKLPGHAELTDALTKAWRASAAADAHYAAWADQVAHNHKLCKGGHAHSTDEVQTANRESGTATEEKKRAVRLWNHIADTYGLTTRQYSQL